MLLLEFVAGSMRLLTMTYVRIHVILLNIQRGFVCSVRSDKHFSIKYFPKHAFTWKIFTKIVCRSIQAAASINGLDILYFPSPFSIDSI